MVIYRGGARGGGRGGGAIPPMVFVFFLGGWGGGLVSLVVGHGHDNTPIPL